MIFKFRAWDYVDKRMFDFQQIKSEFTFEYFEDENLSFMQSTGYLDENGREIFDGDILDAKITGESKSDNLGFVRYSEMFGCWEFEFIDGDVEDLCNLDLETYSIKGNIYENKDLIGN